MSMESRLKTAVIAGSIAAVLIGLSVVGLLAYRARFSPAVPVPNAPTTPPPTSATGTPVASPRPDGGKAAPSGQVGVTGIKDRTPDFTHGPDADKDGLTDSAEALYGTDPHKADTDGDGFADGQEVLVYGSDPLKKESTPATIEGHEKFKL